MLPMPQLWAQHGVQLNMRAPGAVPRRSSRQIKPRRQLGAAAKEEAIQTPGTEDGTTKPGVSNDHRGSETQRGHEHVGEWKEPGSQGHDG